MITPQRAHASHAPENCLNSVPLLVAGAASLQHRAASTRAKLGEMRCDRSTCLAARAMGECHGGSARGEPARGEPARGVEARRGAIRADSARLVAMLLLSLLSLGLPPLTEECVDVSRALTGARSKCRDHGARHGPSAAAAPVPS